MFAVKGGRFITHMKKLNAMLYIAHTGCQWRFLPQSFGPWPRVLSHFRRYIQLEA